MSTYGDISPAVAAYSVAKMLAHAMLDLGNFTAAPQRTIEPIQVPCSTCSAKAGEKCRSRISRWRVDGVHTQRADDARLATEAVRAMSPRSGIQVGDTVTFRRPPNT